MINQFYHQIGLNQRFHKLGRGHHEVVLSGRKKSHLALYHLE